MAETNVLDYELTDFEPLDRRVSQILPRADGGRDAWLTLTGCFLIETAVWGFPFSYGVFQDYYLTHAPFEGQSGVASIATTAIAVMLFGSPFIAIAIQRYPWIRPKAGVAGVVIINTALITASFANSSSVLIFTQGLLYALGGLILYFPAMYLIDEWFITRKGLAFAITWTGTGSGGAVIPFILKWLLDSYGFRTTLRIWTVVITIMTLPALMMMKNRLPITRSSTYRPMDLSFLRQPPFWIYQIPSTIQSLAAFLPSLWLPSFAASMNFPSFSGPLTLCMLNLSVCGGFIIQGQLVDRFHVSVAILVSTIGAMISVFLFWGFATNQAMLYIFSITWGFTGAAWAGNWVGCVADMRKRCQNVDTGLVISLMCAGKGIGTVASGPLSDSLLNSKQWMDAGFAYGSRYGPLITFTGVGVALGGMACFARVLRMV